jgi:hypothetical protein
VSEVNPFFLKIALMQREMSHLVEIKERLGAHKPLAGAASDERVELCRKGGERRGEHDWEELEDEGGEERNENPSGPLLRLFGAARDPRPISFAISDVVAGAFHGGCEESIMAMRTAR